MYDFTGKTVLVTGGAVRVGAALARAFDRAGATVVIHCRHSVAAGEALLRELSDRPHRLLALDFGDPAQADHLFDVVGVTVDILVNNASRYGRFSSVLAEDTAGFQAFFQVNLFAPVSLMRQFARQLPTTADGAVVNVLDQETAHAVPNGGAYALSRRALRDATLEFARELAPRIRVNGVAPGPVLPPVWLPESRMEKTLRRVPLGRPVGLDDLADAVLFLAGNRSVTGEIFGVDGGQHLG